MNKITTILLSIFLAACAGTKQYQSYKVSDTEESSILHIVRENKALGSAIPAPVYVNKQLVGRIGPGGHLTTKIPVGTVAVSSTTSDALIESHQNQTYYVQISMPLQIWFMTPNFDVTQITQETAKEIVPNL